MITIIIIIMITFQSVVKTATNNCFPFRPSQPVKTTLLNSTEQGQPEMAQIYPIQV